MNLEQSMFRQIDEESQAFVKQLAKTSRGDNMP
jgi:hypothetical protein